MSGSGEERGGGGARVDRDRKFPSLLYLKKLLIYLTCFMKNHARLGESRMDIGFAQKGVARLT